MLEAGIALLLIIFLLLIGVPVAFAFASGVLFMVFTLGYEPSFLLPYSFGKCSSMVLLALPFFILLGGLMEKGHTAKYLVGFVNSIVSKMRGGLGAVGSFSMGIFGAISGSGSSAIGCIVPIMVPHMMEEGYPRGYSAAFLTGAAGLAIIIPPSNLMIIYGWLSSTSVTACFLAGMIPGIILMIGFVIFNWILVGRMPMVKKPRSWGSFKQARSEIAHAAWVALPALAMPFLVLGSIYGGILTVTESAGLGAFYAIIVGFFIYRGLTAKTFSNALVRAGVLTGSIIIMLFCAMMIGRMFMMESVPTTVASMMLSVSDNKYILLLMCNAILIIMGMFMDDISCMIIGTTLLLPIMRQIGVSPVHFSAIIVTNLTMGGLTPPMAPLIYIGQRVANSTFPEMIKTSMQIVIFLFLPLVLLTTYVPVLATWLPELILGPKVLLWP